MSLMQDLALSAGLLKELPDNTEDVATRLSRFHRIAANWQMFPVLKILSSKLSMHWKVNRILVALGQEEVRQDFEKQGISDFWLPLSRPILRRLVKDNESIKLFLQCQEELLDTIPRCKRSISDPSSTLFSHHNIEDDETWVTEIRNLGEGAFGIVDEVSVLSETREVVCVRKRIETPKNLKGLTKVMEAFIREVNVMKLVDHYHCVRFIASYTDSQHVNILSVPVAETDLARLLDQPLAPEVTEILYRGIGCLCNAIAYLHRNQIRHEDLKPQNVLILKGEILLTDFGFSLDFSNDSGSTTTGRPSAWTIRYSAPEVLAFEPRNRATDIFSLGCILVEMISGILGHSLTHVKMHWKEHGNQLSSFAQNTVAAESWISQIEFESTSRLRALCDYVLFMLSPNREARPSASQVVDRLIAFSVLFSQSMEVQQCTHADCHGLSPKNQVMRQFKPLLSQLPVQRLFPTTYNPKHLLPYLFPWQYKNGTYGLWDLDLTWFSGRTGFDQDDELAVAYLHERFILTNRDEILMHCKYLYSNAKRNGATSDFWSAHESRVYNIRPWEMADIAEKSMKRLSLRHVVFCQLPVWKVGMEIPPVVAGYLQITLLPMRSVEKKTTRHGQDVHGVFFFMISHVNHFDPENHYIHPSEGPHIIDLTTIT